MILFLDILGFISYISGYIYVDSSSYHFFLYLKTDFEETLSHDSVLLYLKFLVFEFKYLYGCLFN
jgi:hypothetical protein